MNAPTIVCISLAIFSIGILLYLKKNSTKYSKGLFRFLYFFLILYVLIQIIVYLRWGFSSLPIEQTIQQEISLL